jgi:hypothetical protein
VRGTRLRCLDRTLGSDARVAVALETNPSGAQFEALITDERHELMTAVGDDPRDGSRDTHSFGRIKPDAGMGKLRRGDDHISAGGRA